MKMEQTECSETSAYKIQTPGNYPEESIQHSEHGESLTSRITKICPQQAIKMKVWNQISDADYPKTQLEAERRVVTLRTCVHSS
jgi:hypothetical protein